MKSNGAGAEFDFKITKKYLFLLLRVQLQCNVDELGGKSNKAVAELDLSSQRVNIALESTLVHRVQLQCNADEMEGKSTESNESALQRSLLLVPECNSNAKSQRVGWQVDLSFLRVGFA